MKSLVVICLALFAATAWADPRQSHGADGSPYWVSYCNPAEDCFEGAYQWCKGAYVPLDKALLVEGWNYEFRFVCKSNAAELARHAAEEARIAAQKRKAEEEKARYAQLPLCGKENWTSELLAGHCRVENP